MKTPSHHFPNDPPFDDDFDPNDMAADWSPVIDVEETGSQTATMTARRSKTAKTVQASGRDDAQGDDEPIDAAVLSSPVVEEVSGDFISSWNRLVSMTNWEKGKLIHNCRAKLIENGLPRQIYSDESLAKRLGNVSGQHIGRLRRVFERFSTTFGQYPGLYWSHFQAVLDWDDAEDWLADASENQWSVASMRLQRWETIGSPAGQKPNDADIVMSEPDEDVNPYNDSDTVLDGNRKSVEPNRDKDKKKKGEGGNHNGGSGGGSVSGSGGTDNDFGNFSSPAEAFAQMKQMKDLPEDLKEAFEQLKVVILSHKVSGWREVDPQRILTFLNAMKVVIMTEEK
ncbi:MAG: hypothetical protein FWH27_15055 [Planctomycetaceae bacterium]|nr:hypothetical protein [Planctomycetaceae bacterium]